MAQLFANAARAELASDINSTDTTIVLVSGGSLFPVANTGAAAVGPSLDWFKLVLQDLTGYEIVYVRTHTSGSLTFTNVLRGQEGTTAKGFLAGSTVGIRPTAADAASVKDFSGNTTRTVDGTETLAFSGGLKATVQGVLDWVLAKTNTWTGLQVFKGLRETVVTASASTAYTINDTNGTLFIITMTGNVAFTFPTPVAGGQFTIFETQDVGAGSGGNRTPTYPATVRWPNDTQPDRDKTAGKTDVRSFISDGTYWLGFVGGNKYTRA